MKSISKVVQQPEYGFLWTNPHLRDNLIFLTFGGSHAYGTNTIDSDIDIRGCALNSKSDILGLSNFEQVIDNPTDTTIYSFRKLISLITACNPNTIELLGCKPEHYLFYNDEVGQQLLDNRKLFLSKNAAVKAFGGYASQQLSRLENAICRDAMDKKRQEEHILRSIQRAMLSFEDRYAEYGAENLRLYIGESQKEDRDTEILMDIELKGYPLRDYKSMWSEMNEIVKNYGRLNHRNSKKDAAHLNKHAMHLVRLYLMVTDILEKEEINTYRLKDIPLLMDIRNGVYMNDDGTYRADFFEFVSELEREMKYAAENTSLPEKPDMKRIEEFVMSVNQRVVERE